MDGSVVSTFLPGKQKTVFNGLNLIFKEEEYDDRIGIYWFRDYG